MDHNLNGNKCVCCGEYAVEGSWLCWRCQQEVVNTKTAKDYLIEKNNQKTLDKKNKA